MRGAVRPRVLAVAAACAACLVALGGIASAAVWGFRNGGDRSSSGVAGWLILVWVGVAVAVVVVVVVALAGVRSLRRPMVELSRAANQLQIERLPMALREIEAGSEPAPLTGFSAPAELEGVAGALENLERFVHYHAKRAQRADRDLGRLLTGAADRVSARARIAEGIDLVPPSSDSTASISSFASFASGLQRDEGALRALVPETLTATPAPATHSLAPGPSISATVAASTRTTLRPPAVAIGELEPAIVDAGASTAVMVVLGEVIDAAIGADGRAAVSGTVQPEGYHFVVDAAIGARGDELAYVAEALRERDPGHLPFGLRAAVQAGRRARLLVWLTVADHDAQWHVLVPPDAFFAAAPPVAPEPDVEPVVEGTAEPPVEPAIEPASEPAVEPTAETELEPAGEPSLEPAAVIDPVEAAEPPVEAPVEKAPVDLAQVAAARRLGEALTNLFARLEIALERRAPDGEGLDEDERVALLVDGTRLVGKLQQAQLCSSRALRALLRAIDVAVGADRSLPLAGSARGRVTLPYEALAEIREHVAEAAGVFPVPPGQVKLDMDAPLP